MKRGAGILMPIFSLVNEEKYGTLGKCAYKFVDFLAKCNQRYWQVLPINEADNFGSPFCSTCVYSGNPLFIDLTDLIDKEKLEVISKKENLTYSQYKKLKMELLYEAYKTSDFSKEIQEFVKHNEWVTSYAEFMTIKEKYSTLSKFPLELRNKESEECRKYLKNNENKVNFYIFCQYLFFDQWFKLKEYANKKGILIIGDSPCNSAMDSKEAWADKEMYLLDENLTPTFVAGVPPDYFSNTGQVWNTLIYNYEKIKQDNYRYLIDKYKYLLNVYDYLKIDHFRGIECYYKIPFGQEDGKIGEWVMGPGYEFIDLLKNNSINNLILEDLGIISDGVIKLRDYSGYPYMKVFQFAFSQENSPFLPENYSNNCVAYTGTHDNDTFYSFLSDEDNKKAVAKYLNINEEASIKEVLFSSIGKLYYSIADIVIINPQDLLCQTSEYRFNSPGTVEGNWGYSCDRKIYSKSNIEFLSTLALSSKRSG